MTANSEFYTALNSALAEIRNPSKDAKADTGTYGYTYLSYDQASDYLRPVLAKHGLGWMHDVSNDDTHVLVRTVIFHTSGQTLEVGPVSWPMPEKVQTYGGLISYLKRYQLVSTFGLGAGDDDDAQEANKITRVKVKHDGPLGAQEAKRNAGPSTDKQIAFIVALMKKQGLNEVALNTLTTTDLGFEVPVGGLAYLTFDQASRLIERMKRPASTPVWDDAPLVDPATGEVAQ